MENVDNNEEPQSLPSAGARLRAAREAAGLSRSDLALRTKIAERHLIAIEEDRFGDLAARTYAVGFARSYARAVGISETEIAEEVRQQLDAEAHDRPAVAPSFEPGDPARVPSARLAWAAAIGVVIVIGLLLFFWSSYLRPEGALPSLVDEGATESTSPAVASVPTVAPAPAPAPATATGPIVLTAAADQVWIKVTDAAGAQVVQKELVHGETWTVPEGSSGLTLRTGRPDALKITVGGREIPALSDKPQLLSVPLGAADLLARGTARPGTPSSSTPTAAGTPMSSATALAEPTVAATAEVPTSGPTSPISTESR